MLIASLTIREELGDVAAFLGVIWGVFVVSRFVPQLNCYGVVPRTLRGLAGIPAMPFLHRNLNHILGNTFPLFILLALLAGSRARPWQVIVELVLLGGLLLWLLGRSKVHIGASGLIFALIAFLIVSGFLEKRLVSFAVAVLVGFVYGGTLISGVLPRFRSHISWEGHLCCAVAGGIVAYALTS
jgi:membrane associated rhomboid family serine protease